MLELLLLLLLLLLLSYITSITIIAIITFFMLFNYDVHEKIAALLRTAPSLRTWQLLVGLLLARPDTNHQIKLWH